MLTPQNTRRNPRSDRPFAARHRAAGIGALAAAALAGCQTPHYFDEARAIRGPAECAAVPSPDVARDLPIFAGTDGAALGWDDLMDAVAWADIIIIGESHDDAVGHAVQLAVVEDTVRRWPRTVLSMEMLERDEQPLVDDYFDGIIDAETLAKLTFSENWGAKGMWFDWYQPIVDAAKDGGGRVVAANAPRRYVRLARTGGYARLAGVPRARRQWFDYPARVPEGAYRDRFLEMMTSAHAPPAGADDEDEDEDNDAQDDGAAGADGAEDMTHDVGDSDDAVDADEPAIPEHAAPVHAPPPPLSQGMVEAMFRSQLVWDATMATSIAQASFRGAPKVVHLVGQFHSDFEGGTVVELRKRKPGARILVISMQQAWPGGLRPEDAGRADVIVFTGDRPEEPEEIEGEGEGEGEGEDGHEDERGDAGEGKGED